MRKSACNIIAGMSLAACIMTACQDEEVVKGFDAEGRHPISLSGEIIHEKDQTIFNRSVTRGNCRGVRAGHHSYRYCY